MDCAYGHSPFYSMEIHMASIQEVTNVITLANACALVSEVIMEIAGNEISSHIQGSPVTRDTINGLALASINKELGGNRNAG